MHPAVLLPRHSAKTTEANNMACGTKKCATKKAVAKKPAKKTVKK